MRIFMISGSYFLLFFIYFSRFHRTNAGTFSVDYTNHQFIKDGKPFKYISGSFHYFRIHQDLWDDRLKRIRALGLNAISTYAAWNLHEPTPGNFDFSGFANLSYFLTLAQQNNLNVIFRPGPYIDAEWENGGLPYWLLKYDGIKMRTSDANYTNAVKNYFNKLMDVIKPFLYQNGGPILMVQVENEYGAIGACDHNYTTWLRDFIWSKLGNDTVLYTTDNPNNQFLTCGRLPNTVTTVDFSPSDDGTIDGYFATQDAHSNGAPHVCSEYYTDWYLFWSQSGPNFRNTSQIIDNINHIHYAKNGSVNLYLVYGGKNYGFFNGAYLHAPITTAYWIGAPIAENGNFSDQYWAIRSFISNLSDWEQPPTPVPSVNPASNYGQVTLNRVGANLISTLTTIQETCSTSQDPLTFEQLDHPYGYVLYTTTLKTGGKVFSAPNIRDYGFIFINNNYQGFISVDGQSNLTLNNAAQAGDVLRVVVENQGRKCSWSGKMWDYPVPDFKGLNPDQNGVTLDGTLLQDWYQCGINLTKSTIDSLSKSFYEEKPQYSQENLPEKATSQPGVYIGQFDANVLQDTYLDSTGWGKGQLFINGYNLGRYWPRMGPQMTLYVPKPYLQSKNNTVVLIELEGTTQNYVNFIDHSIFQY